MTYERLTVKAVIVPLDGPGEVLLTDAGEFVADAVLDLDLEFDHYVREVGEDGAGITCIGLEIENEAAEPTRLRVERALMELVKKVPELAGWDPLVAVVDASSDDDEDLAESGDIDAEAERLVPSGDEIVESLLHEIRYERSIYEDARLFQAMPIEDLCTEDPAHLDSDERAAALRRASALAGCLVQASVVVIDHLISDIVDLRQEETGATRNIGDTWVLSDLPPRFAPNYTVLFAQRFLVALVDVTSRMTGGWAPLSCVAQELGLRLLLNEVEVVADAAGVALDQNWRGPLEDTLFEDADHELLYNPRFDGIEDDAASQPPGMAPMRFADWFKPFNDERSLPPYALDA